MSTTSGEASELSSNSNEAGSVKQSPNTKFEFTWHDLNFVNDHINDKAWSRRRIPADIESLPQNVIISDTVGQILRWSILRLQDFSDGVGARDPGERQKNSSINNEHTGSHMEPQVDDTIAPVEAISVKNDEAETLSTASSANLGRTKPLVSRLKQIRQDMATRIALKAQSKVLTAPVVSADAIKETLPNGECISCYDEFAKLDLVRTKCSHDYCKQCLREVVLNAMKTETAFPPKCCLTEIPLKLVLTCLDKDQRDEYREKSAEYSVSIKDTLKRLNAKSR